MTVFQKKCGKTAKSHSSGGMDIPPEEFFSDKKHATLPSGGENNEKPGRMRRTPARRNQITGDKGDAGDEPEPTGGPGGDLAEDDFAIREREAPADD